MTSLPNYLETLRYLYDLQWRGMKFGLRNTRAILKQIGNPHRRFSSVHLAGTNGKGSTSAYLASIALEGGLKTGLYTSPHLLRFTERIRVNGTELSEDRLVYYVNDLRRAIESVHATFFEATTCVAFRYFADENVELAVVETGLGGRFDATNVLLPLASVITSIGLDHTQYLGSSPARIAFEKGGIIKRGIPVVTGALGREASGVLRRIAEKREAPFVLASRRAPCAIGRTRAGYRMTFKGGLAKGLAVTPGLRGIHQVRNAQLAVATLSVLTGRGDLLPLSRKVIREGLMRVRRNSGLRGRMEIVESGGGRYILDVGHNPDGIRTLVQALEAERLVPAVVVFGVMEDKDSISMLAALRPLTGRLIAVAPHMPRSLSAVETGRRAKDAGFTADRASSVAAGLHAARAIAGRSDVLVTGSHYVVAEALKTLEESSG
jgi:dihydrofolate synthase/folylpolyglutamate synthase